MGPGAGRARVRPPARGAGGFCVGMPGWYTVVPVLLVWRRHLLLTNQMVYLKRGVRQPCRASGRSRQRKQPHRPARKAEWLLALLLREPHVQNLLPALLPARPSLNPRLGPPPSGLYTPRCTPAVHGVEEPVLLLSMHPTARDCACVSGQATRGFPDGTLLVVPRPVLMSSPSGSSGGVVLGGDV